MAQNGCVQGVVNDVLPGSPTWLAVVRRPTLIIGDLRINSKTTRLVRPQADGL